MVESNPHKISTMGQGGSLAAITDASDFPHTGLIKGLSQMARQNLVVRNNSNDFDISQGTGGSGTVAVSAGTYLRDGKLYTAQYKTGTTAASFTFGAGELITTYDKGYHLVVVDKNNFILIRKPTVLNKVPDYTAGDTIIAIVEYSSTTSSGARNVQFLTTDKAENSLSIAYDNSNVYTEVGTLQGVAGGTTLDSTVGALTLTSANDVTVKLGGIATSDVFSVTDSADQVQLSVNANGAVTLASGGSITIGSASINETELEIIDGATLSTTELNTLDGVAATLTATELNYVDGVTSAIQTQLDAKVKQGKHTMWIPSSAMTPLTTNGCSDLTLVEMTATRPELQVLDFAADAPDYAQFTVAFPKSWNEGTVTFQPFWTVTGTDGGGVNWTLTGISIADNGIINSGYPSAATQASKAHSGTSNDLNVSVESGTLTITNAAVDTVTYFKIARNTADGGDDQTGVARLIGIKMFYTTDAENDA